MVIEILLIALINCQITERQFPVSAEPFYGEDGNNLSMSNSCRDPNSKATQFIGTIPLGEKDVLNSPTKKRPQRNSVKKLYEMERETEKSV